MHYENGRKAMLGDMVRGKADAFPFEITGILVHASAGSDTCNGSVATVARGEHYGSTVFAPVMADETGEKWKIAGSNANALVLTLTIDLKDFVALDTKTGEVLPPIS